MPSPDSAPYTGDIKLNAQQTRAYYRYAWRELRQNREPLGVQQAIPEALTPDDSRSPYRVYADTLMKQIIGEYVREPAEIIDIGCGKGLYAALFKSFRGTYHGVDAFEYPEWTTVNQLAESEGWTVEVRFYHHPAEGLDGLPIQSNFSLSSSALEHVDDPDAAVVGLAKLTQSGSYGLHIVPAPWSLFGYGKHGWRRFSAERLRQLFEDAGFECVSLYRLGGIPSTAVQYMWLMGIEEGLALQSLTFATLPNMIYRAFSFFRFPAARTNRWSGAIYRFMLRLALKTDRFLPKMASGYAILVRRK